MFLLESYTSMLNFLMYIFLYIQVCISVVQYPFYKNLVNSLIAQNICIYFTLTTTPV